MRRTAQAAAGVKQASKQTGRNQTTVPQLLACKVLQPNSAVRSSSESVSRSARHEGSTRMMD